MKSLAQRVAQRSQNEEQLAKQVSNLETSVEEWKTRHAKARAHLRTLRASSGGFYIQQPNAPQFIKANGFVDPKGLVRDTSVTQFQLAVDELLQLARAEDPTPVLPYMRHMVTCVRGVTGDVSEAVASGNPRGMSKGDVEKRKKAEQRVAAATNNLISTAKNHATSSGLAPVALVDAASGHLVGAVVELVKMVKVRPTAEGELGDDFS